MVTFWSVSFAAWMTWLFISKMRWVLMSVTSSVTGAVFDASSMPWRIEPMPSVVGWPSRGVAARLRRDVDVAADRAQTGRVHEAREEDLAELDLIVLAGDVAGHDAVLRDVDPARVLRDRDLGLQAVARRVREDDLPLLVDREVAGARVADPLADILRDLDLEEAVALDHEVVGLRGRLGGALREVELRARDLRAEADIEAGRPLDAVAAGDAGLR